MAQKPIDFIENPIVEETIWISLETANYNLTVYQKSTYRIECDEKWINFCRQRKLSKQEKLSAKWRELFLDLCAEGIL